MDSCQRNCDTTTYPANDALSNVNEILIRGSRMVKLNVITLTFLKQSDLIESRMDRRNFADAMNYAS